MSEIEHSKALNEEYKSKEDGFRKQIVNLNDVIEALKEKYYKAKHSNKTLKQQLLAVREKKRVGLVLFIMDIDELLYWPLISFNLINSSLNSSMRN